MAVIRIQERTNGPDGTNAIVSFDNGPEYPITITNPFDEKQEEELEWYFEEHLEFPFTKKVRAQNAAASITTYGETLFKQVFGDPDIYAEYRALLKVGLHDLQIEIAGSPKFHALHWESIKDPKLEEPLALHVAIVRRNLKLQALSALVRPSPVINLLIVTARPSGIHDVGYRTISRPLVEALHNANLRVQIEILRPGTYRALKNHLHDVTAIHGEGYYHVIHFDVHGFVFNNKDVYLSFEREQDNVGSDIKAKEIANLLQSHKVPIAILNACQSGKQIGERETNLANDLIQAGLQLVLAMNYSVTVSAAKLLMSSLYRHLFSGDDFAVAISHARTELYNNKARRAYFDQNIDLEDWLLPVVYQNQLVQLLPREFTQEERASWDEQKAEWKSATVPDPNYGFVGRDIDILQIEKRLLTKSNILLVRGMVVAGKTTLLRHLTTWWQTTGFVQHVFYFSYDEKAWTLEQLMTSIAQNLYGIKYCSDFQPLPLVAQQAMLSKDLISKSHLLILDNLEFITYQHLSIQHTLPPEEQAALHRFLTDLVKGNTFVLLGSRSDESWLAKGTFDDNVYNLSGLDPEAVSTLAEHILERINATKYLQDEDLKKLIKVLDGFPMVLEVVLANLVHHTPVEVLAALQSGDISIDLKSDSWNKTENILSCIDYSFSNFSTEAQQTLLCLSPFTSIINTDLLDNYTSFLRQQPTLELLPFEHWSEVLQEAENWGLILPDKDNPNFIHLQPIFPYFLRKRLHMPDLKEVRSDVETAFLEYYYLLGGSLFRMLQSDKPQERQVGHMITGLEYENLFTALNLALSAQTSILNPFIALSKYLDNTQDQFRGLELGQAVLSSLENYSSDKLVGQLGTELVSVIDSVAFRQLKLKEYRAAEMSYQKALGLQLQITIFDETTTKKLCASIYHQLGIVAHEQLQWKKAEQYYHQALNIEIEYNDHNMQAQTYFQLGKMAEEQQEWKKSERYYEQALRIEIERNYRYMQADTYHNLGVVAQRQGQFQKAESYYKQALIIKADNNNRYALAQSYHQLGRMAEEQQEWKKSERYYEQALQFYIGYEDRGEQARTYYNLGDVAYKQGQWEQAEQYYQEALLTQIECKDRFGQANTYMQLGLLNRDLKQWSQASKNLLHALHIFIEFEDNHSIGIAVSNLAEIYKVNDDVNLPAAVASILGASVEDTEKLLRKALGEK